MVTETNEDEVEDVLGYIRTQVECPSCGEIHDLEGDQSSTTFTCECGLTLRIYEVR